MIWAPVNIALAHVTPTLLITLLCLTPCHTPNFYSHSMTNSLLLYSLHSHSMSYSLLLFTLHDQLSTSLFITFLTPWHTLYFLLQLMISWALYTFVTHYTYQSCIWSSVQLVSTNICLYKLAKWGPLYPHFELAPWKPSATWTSSTSFTYLLWLST